MEILYLLIPLAVLIAIVIVGALLWAVRSGQFEDLEGPAHRILMDDERPLADANSPADGDTPDNAGLDPPNHRR
jgi:cbb3-type cytochrome oxidase maturation protein